MDKNTPFFSVIIPVYNVLPFLEACVGSVLAQTFSDYEILLVDDGSTDGSGDLCDRLAAGEARIRVLHQQNQGLSGARNSGLRMASGTYVLFLDSDDFYPQTDFLEKLHGGCRDRDVVCFNYARYTDRLQELLISFPEDTGTDADGFWLELVRRNAWQSSACIKAVKRQLLLDKAIDFEPGVISEDIEWSAKVMRAAHSAAVVPDCVYAYRVRQGSITKTFRPEHVAMQLGIVKKLAEADPEGTAVFREAYFGYTAFQYCTVLINERLCRPRPEKGFHAQVRALSWLLKHDANGRVRLIHTVSKLLGLELTQRLLLVYFRLFCN